MSAVMGNKELGLRSYFQVGIRLQLVRAQVHEWLHRGTAWTPKPAEIKEILGGIQGVAVAAHDAGFGGFSSVCLRVCARIEPLSHGGGMPRMTLELLADWSANSDLYLRRSHRIEFATALVVQLNDPRWGTKLDHAEQESLIRAMLEPAS